MLLKNARVLNDNFEFINADVLTDREIIKSIGKNISGEADIDLDGKMLLPGLIDVHTHGAVSVDSMDETVDFEKWKNYLLRNGITTFFPTTVTDTFENILRAFDNLKDSDGINVEGPFLSAAKKGAHLAELIVPCDISFVEKIKEKTKLITIAPEIEGNIEAIAKIVKMGIKVSAGHSACDFETAQKAFANGATELTHTFNGMNSLHHREPSLVGAALVNDNVYCEVISDGFHLNPAIVKLIYKVKTADKMILISDAMAATGLLDGKYRLCGSDVFVKNGQARLADGTIAGSTHNLMDMMRYAHSFGIPLEDCVKMASLTPARSMGMDKKIGSIKEGKIANMIISDDKLNVINTIYKGKKLF